MISTALSYTIVGALLFANRAQSLPHNPNQQPRVISLPLEVRESYAAGLEKRQKATGLSYPDDNDQYNLARRVDVAVQLKIGRDNPQAVTLALDTGSEYTWVNPVCNNAQEAMKGICRAYGHFDVEKSNSERQDEYDPSTPLPFADKSTATLEFYDDFVSLGNGLDIQEQLFGVAKDSQGLHAGILGLAISGDYKDYSVLNTMKEQNVINDAAFSIDFGSLNPAARGKGSVVFGGVDAGRFKGKLEKRPLLEHGGTVREFVIQLDGMTFSTQSASLSMITSPVKVLVDSGATTNYFPRDFMDHYFGPSFLGSVKNGNYMVKCSIGKIPGSIDFKFGSTVIKTSFQSLVENPSGRPDSEDCFFRIQPSDNIDDWSLGLPFFESAYTVFDHDAPAVYVAPAAFCDSELVQMKDISDKTGCP